MGLWRLKWCLLRPWQRRCWPIPPKVVTTAADAVTASAEVLVVMTKVSAVAVEVLAAAEVVDMGVAAPVDLETKVVVRAIKIMVSAV